MFLNALGRMKLSRTDSLHSPLHLLLLLVVSLWVLVLFGLLREPGLDYGSPKHINGANRCEQEKKPEPVAVKRKDLSCRRENYGVFDVPSWTERLDVVRFSSNKTYSATPPSRFKSVPESRIAPVSASCGRLIIFMN